MTTCRAILTILADAPGAGLAVFTLTCDREAKHLGPHYLVQRITDDTPRLAWSDDGRDLRAAWVDSLSAPPDSLRFGSRFYGRRVLTDREEVEAGAATPEVS